MDLLSYSMDNVTGFPNTICWIVIYAVDIVCYQIFEQMGPDT